MTTEEKIRNARELFYSLSHGENRDVKVSNTILNSSGLTIEEFWEIICPRLESEGAIETIAGRLAIPEQYGGDESKFYFHFKVNGKKLKQIINRTTGSIRSNLGQGSVGESGLHVKPQEVTNPLTIQLKGGKLTINQNTGDIKLNKVETNLNPESQEFRILLQLMMAKDYKVIYTDLLIDPSKVNKRSLTFVLRNLKESLKILPKRTAQNKDIIKNIKNHGYRLIV